MKLSNTLTPRFGDLYHLNGTPPERADAVALLRTEARKQNVELAAYRTTDETYILTGPQDAKIGRPLETLTEDWDQFRTQSTALCQQLEAEYAVARDTQLSALLETFMPLLADNASRLEAGKAFITAANISTEQLDKSQKEKLAAFDAQHNPTKALWGLHDRLPRAGYLRAADVMQWLPKGQLDIQTGQFVRFPRLRKFLANLSSPTA